MRKQLQLFILLITLGAANSFAQSVQWAQKAGGTGYDNGNAISVDASGNTYVSGLFEGTATFGSIPVTSTGGYNVFVAKYDAAGVAQWVQQGGGTGYDGGYGITSDGSGNVYVTGYFSGVATFGSFILTSAGSDDIFIAKYDALGVIQWVQQAGSTTGDYGYGVRVDGSGNVYITGSFTGTAAFGLTNLVSSGLDDAFVAMYDNSGALQWAEQAGGTGYDAGYGIGIDVLGNTYVTGTFSGIATFNTTPLTSQGGADIFIAGYNTSGVLQWAKQAGGTGDDEGWSIIADASGNSTLTGYFNGNGIFETDTITSAGNDDIFVARYDSLGVFQWVSQAGGTSADAGYCISSDAYGNVYVGGAFEGTATFGTATIMSSGFTDVFVAKYDAAGVSQWVQDAGGTVFDGGFAISADSSGNAFATGRFASTANFGSTALTSTGSDDLFIMKMSSLSTEPLSAVTFCEGATLDVVYTVNGAFGTGNVFTAELSDASGSFASPVTIGSLASSTSDTIFGAVIPLLTPSGTAYRIRVVASNPATAGADNGTDITINALPVVTQTAFSDVCENAPAFTLTGGAPAGGIYSGTGVNVGDFDPSTAGVGTHIITYTYADGNGCESSAIDSIKVDPAPVNNLSPNTATCSSTLVLDAGNVGSTYMWNTAATSQTITVSTGGVYYVDVTNSFGCTSSDTTIAQFNTPPTVNLGPNQTICDINSDVVTLDAGAGYDTYAWTGSFNTQTISLYGSTLGAGTYTYSVTVTDTNGCTGTDNVIITVTACTGIEENTGFSGVAVYPNPNEGVFYLELNSTVNENISLRVLNSLGEVIVDEKHRLTGNSKLPVDVADAAPGVYFIELKTNKEVITKRVVVK